MFKYELHAIVKDKVTGFRGVVLARTEYATGCKSYALASQKLKEDGTILDWQWFDEMRLEDTGKKIKSISDIGGPAPRAPQSN